jgi:hypothetical protein
LDDSETINRPTGQNQENKMSGELQVIDIKKMSEMAKVVAESRLWPQFDSPQKVMGLMLLCQSHGMHPMHAVQHYDLIQGKPSRKSESQLAEFYSRGGKVKWIERTDKICKAVFTSANCPDGVEVVWTIEQAQKANLTGKDNWRGYPRQMLSARVQAEGVQIVDPGAGLGMPVTEEALDMGNERTEKAAIASFELVGESQADAPESVAELSTSIDYKKARADLNRSLLACETEKEFRATCASFQSKHDKGTWIELTGVRSEETFETLAKEHLARIMERGPTGRQKWLDELSKVSTADVFYQFYGAYQNAKWLQVVDCEDALNAKAKELGFENGLESVEVSLAQA